MSSLASLVAGGTKLWLDSIDPGHAGTWMNVAFPKEAGA